MRLKIFISAAFFAMVLQIFAQHSDDLDTVPAKKNKAITTVLEVGIPSLMIAYGVYSLENQALDHIDHSTKNELHEDGLIWKQNWDDVIQFAPGFAAFGLKLAGVKSRHKLSDMAIIYGLSNLLETGIIYGTKSITRRHRPDGSGNNSFPSGHTATAFVGAEFLFQEYKDKSIWIGISGYAVAALVGISRVYRNKHWVSDVVAGAGVGILSTKIIYWTYPYFQKKSGKNKNGKFQSMLFPAYRDGTLGINFSMKF